MERKYELFDGNGNIVESIDERTVTVQASNKVEEIKAACAKAIEATGLGWMVEREVSGGAAVPQNVKDICAAHRTRSNQLEAEIAAAVSEAEGDDDKSACDAIQAIVW